MIKPEHLPRGLSPDDVQLCRSLRGQSISRDLDDPGEIAAAFARNHVPYSCLKTCQPWGPDDDVAAPELCTRDRGCYQPTRSLIRRKRDDEPG